MKKILLLSILAAAVAINAGAQSFKHLSIGVGTGLDGNNLEFATNLGDHVQMRLGFGVPLGAGYTFKGKEGADIDEHPRVEDSPTVTVPMKVSLARNDARLLFNLYPSMNKVFHFTLGAYVGNGTFFRAIVKDLPEDYSTTGFDIDGHTIKAIDNKIRMDAKAFGLGNSKLAILPYAGLGFGRPLRYDDWITFSFDIGALYSGRPSLWLRTQESGNAIFYDITDSEDLGIKEDLDDIEKYVSFFPVINFHIYFKLF